MWRFKEDRRRPAELLDNDESPRAATAVHSVWRAGGALG